MKYQLKHLVNANIIHPLLFNLIIMKKPVDTISTKSGEFPVEKRPGNWQQYAGALKDASEEIQKVLQIMAQEKDGQ